MAITNYKTNEYEDAFKLINRNTRRADLKNNALALTIFDKYNTTVDKNGKTDDVFDDNEWSTYQNYLNKIQERKKNLMELKQNHAMKVFQKRIEKSEKRIEELIHLDMELQKEEPFLDFVKYEGEVDEKYGIYILKSLKNNEDIEKAKQNGAIIRDISIFERGNEVDENGSWTGIQQYAYIEFPDEMPEEERNKFLDRLDKTIAKMHQIKAKREPLMREINKEHEKLEAAEINLDAIITGRKRGVGTTEEQTQIYNSAKEKDFVKEQIDKLNEERRRLWLKANPTDTDKLRIAAIDNQIQQLLNVQYSSVYMMDESENSSSYGLAVNYQEKATYTDNDCELAGSHTITDSHKADLSYTAPDFRATLSGEKTEKYFVKNGNVKDGEITPPSFQNQYNISTSLNYSRNDWTVSSDASLNINRNSLRQNYSVSGGYKHSSVNFGKEISTFKSNSTDENGESQEQKVNTYSTTLSVNQGIGNGSINGSIKWSDDQEARIYELGGRYNLQKAVKNEMWEFSTTPSLSCSYLDSWGAQSDSWSLNAGLSNSVAFRSGKFSTNLDVSEQYTGSYSTGKPTNTNTVNVSSRTTYNKLSLTAGYTYQVTDGPNFLSKMKQGNFAIGYQSKAGELEGSYSISKNDSKYDNISQPTSWTNTFTLTFRTSLDNLKQVFSKKKKQN